MTKARIVKRTHPSGSVEYVIQQTNMEHKQDKSNEAQSGQLRQADVSGRTSMPCPNCGGAGWHLHCDRWGNLTGTSQCLICHGSGVFTYVR